MAMKLNWGSAFDKHDGWLGSDLDDHGQEHVGDLLDGLPWEPETFDVVVSHHALQIIKYTDMEAALHELRRVLKPGGVLRVSVPDVIGAFNAWMNGDAHWFPVGDDVQPSIDGKLSAYLTWYSEARSAFTPGYILDLLRPNGWSDYDICGYQQTTFGRHIEGLLDLDKRPNESLFFEAVK